MVWDHWPVQQISSRVVYANAWMSVREDQVQRQDGSTGIYGVVDKPDFALIIPRGPDGFWMVEQYRYPVERRAWEFPQGSWAGSPEGDQLALAQTELLEETGLRAAKMEHLGHLFEAYGFSTQGFDVFLAGDLTPGEPRREITEDDMTHRFVTDLELYEMIKSGDVVDAPSLAALSLYQLHQQANATTEAVPHDRQDSPQQS
jgi:8-oxo-dGTP pyrophosphatase MutT (NUDIX family)